MTAPREIVVVSGAPGTGKTTVAAVLAERLGFPLLSLDAIKETLADQLGLGDEDWSDRLGDAAAEVIFRLAPTFPATIVEGWWRRERRDRAEREFHGSLQVFCSCEPALAAERMERRLHAQRHPIHRDVMNPEVLRRAGEHAKSVVPLALDGILVAVDTTTSVAWDQLEHDVRVGLRMP